jgi:hypothetical protein
VRRVRGPNDAQPVSPFRQDLPLRSISSMASEGPHVPAA